MGCLLGEPCLLLRHPRRTIWIAYHRLPENRLKPSAGRRVASCQQVKMIAVARESPPAILAAWMAVPEGISTERAGWSAITLRLAPIMESYIIFWSDP